jgi:hypothetical protein
MAIFCETCCEKVEYTVHPVRKKTNIKGAEINYRGKEALCIECRNVIFVPEIRVYNLKQIEKKHF